MVSPVINWIEESVAGKTFADIGGIGLDSLNERVSVAANAKAAKATMIDFRKFGFPEWEIFERKMQERGVTDYGKIDGANLEASTFPDQVGQFDFVHCTGILYHAPAPIVMLDNLSRITRQLLIVNTVIVPETVETEVGTLHYPGSQILFLPGISEDERKILEAYYQKLLDWPPNRFSAFAPRIEDENAAMPWLQTRAASDKHFWADKGALSYSPYWMLFTKPAFRAAVKMFGFKIKAEHSFKGHTLTLFCERA